MGIVNSLLFGGIGALIILKLAVLATAVVLLLRALPQPVPAPVRVNRQRPVARSLARAHPASE